MGIANETAEGVLAHVEGERRHRIVVERAKAFVALHREAESLRYLFDRELSLTFWMELLSIIESSGIDSY